MKDLTLGDLVGTGNDPAVDALLDRALGRKVRPKKILVRTPGNIFHWARPVLVEDTANMVEAPRVA